MNILGIETSCDDTAAAVIQNGTTIRSNVVASQKEMHKKYGGIIPEISSREHFLNFLPVVNEALDIAGITYHDLDGIAVTNGPGLAGALLVGVNSAKGLAMSWDKPLIGINHLEGHIYSAWLENNDFSKTHGFPMVCLIASGGHTDLVLMKDHLVYETIGRTVDDAAGEAFDKAARVLGLGFPGGPEIQRVSEGAAGDEHLPRAWMRDTLDFSFSGIKTALLHMAQDRGIYPSSEDVVDRQRIVRELAAAFQESIVDVVSAKLIEMAAKYKVKGLILGGGVTANARLREEIVARSPLPVIIPPPILCTDNGAMIASCGFFHLQRGQYSSLDLDVNPALSL